MTYETLNYYVYIRYITGFVRVTVDRLYTLPVISSSVSVASWRVLVYQLLDARRNFVAGYNGLYVRAGVNLGLLRLFATDIRAYDTVSITWC